MDLQKNGWAGAVIYGCVRDAEVLATVQIGVTRPSHAPQERWRFELKLCWSRTSKTDR